jgi:hypothetical protein|tara:strand:- start:27 stop:476 length:450 start_codon:yes stop_codon:yes gene_type:complete
MSEFAEKKALRSQIAAAKKAGKSVQTIGRLQYKLNQLMKNPQKGKPVKRKTPLTGSPSAGTAKKKAPDMYNKAVALDKPNVTVTKYPKSNVKSVVRKRNEDPVLNKSGNPHAGMTQIGARTWVKKSNLTSRQKDLAREYASIVRKRNNK